MTTVLVFGTFDRLHPGHQSFFAQAKTLGDRLLVVVARDEVVEKYKGRHPDEPLEMRLQKVRADTHVDEAIPGDTLEGQGTYAVIEAYHPDIVALGYDQEKLSKNIQSHPLFRDRLKTVTLEPFRPDIYKSSILREKIKK
ncbi:MAG: adenylyltransferase/cytidyltransferase family protein [Candidatus Uhrbacteria bacterium]|nr:adenylyltransferase/cytidyltransferase family protein [Candidatus Uhrbacteria bacterium]